MGSTQTAAEWEPLRPLCAPPPPQSAWVGQTDEAHSHVLAGAAVPMVTRQHGHGCGARLCLGAFTIGDHCGHQDWKGHGSGGSVGPSANASVSAGSHGGTDPQAQTLLAHLHVGGLTTPPMRQGCTGGVSAGARGQQRPLEGR